MIADHIFGEKIGMNSVKLLPEAKEKIIVIFCIDKTTLDHRVKKSKRSKLYGFSKR